ncbi:hypothetical protein [Bradyrhizobium sp.]|uniref:hypothetical protein n=1 Tax=Bradyrhizobium sp. TaxID=376 RepID=UPI001EC3557B|nr:hypothetical protein [Bradyrhizobium sp.]MBV8920578.1 hypothetical protein [Bradyrhizobium sp.]MBV9981831.1 hypothetical protein [Bradyrhizobium sp.]
MRARKILIVILIAFAAASAIAALTTMRQVRLEGSGPPFSELRTAPYRSSPPAARL